MHGSRAERSRCQRILSFSGLQAAGCRLQSEPNGHEEETSACCMVVWSSWLEAVVASGRLALRRWSASLFQEKRPLKLMQVRTGRGGTGGRGHRCMDPKAWARRHGRRPWCNGVVVTDQCQSDSSFWQRGYHQITTYPDSCHGMPCWTAYASPPMTIVARSSSEGGRQR